jgi:hypothetical protein
MRDETIRLGSREQRRAQNLNQVLEGQLTIGSAVPLLGLSTGQDHLPIPDEESRRCYSKW